MRMGERTGEYDDNNYNGGRTTCKGENEEYEDNNEYGGITTTMGDNGYNGEITTTMGVKREWWNMGEKLDDPLKFRHHFFFDPPKISSSLCEISSSLFLRFDPPKKKIFVITFRNFVITFSQILTPPQ